ncbi:hypothetical protein DIPPA_30299 [Diplonema papillatum]|nr:hypothetical protein DIPPA_30299 [Diplonema papillatum]
MTRVDYDAAARRIQAGTRQYQARRELCLRQRNEAVTAAIEDRAVRFFEAVLTLQSFARSFLAHAARRAQAAAGVPVARQQLREGSDPTFGRPAETDHEPVCVIQRQWRCAASRAALRIRKATAREHLARQLLREGSDPTSGKPAGSDHEPACAIQRQWRCARSRAALRMRKATAREHLARQLLREGSDPTSGKPAGSDHEPACAIQRQWRCARSRTALRARKAAAREYLARLQSTGEKPHSAPWSPPTRSVAAADARSSDPVDAAARVIQRCFRCAHAKGQSQAKKQQTAAYIGSLLAGETHSHSTLCEQPRVHQRQQQAAVAVQCCWRQAAARRSLDEKTVAARRYIGELVLEQQDARGGGDRIRAALQLQCWWRHTAARRSLFHRKVTAREYVARLVRDEQRDTRRERAALTVQSWWRGRSSGALVRARAAAVRVCVLQLVDEDRSGDSGHREHAAMTVQSWWRGQLAGATVRGRAAAVRAYTRQLAAEEKPGDGRRSVPAVRRSPALRLQCWWRRCAASAGAQSKAAAVREYVQEQTRYDKSPGTGPAPASEAAVLRLQCWWRRCAASAAAQSKAAAVREYVQEQAQHEKSAGTGPAPASEGAALLLQCWWRRCAASAAAQSKAAAVREYVQEQAQHEKSAGTGPALGSEGAALLLQCWWRRCAASAAAQSKAAAVREYVQEQAQHEKSPDRPALDSEGAALRLVQREQTHETPAADRRETAAAVQLQRWWRSCAERARGPAGGDAEAVVVQSAWRGYVARRRVSGKRSQLADAWRDRVLKDRARDKADMRRLEDAVCALQAAHRVRTAKETVRRARLALAAQRRAVAESVAMWRHDHHVPPPAAATLQRAWRCHRARQRAAERHRAIFEAKVHRRRCERGGAAHAIQLVWWSYISWKNLCDTPALRIQAWYRLQTVRRVKRRRKAAAVISRLAKRVARHAHRVRAVATISLARRMALHRRQRQRELRSWLLEGYLTRHAAAFVLQRAWVVWKLALAENRGRARIESGWIQAASAAVVEFRRTVPALPTAALPRLLLNDYMAKVGCIWRREDAARMRLSTDQQAELSEHRHRCRNAHIRSQAAATARVVKRKCKASGFDSARDASGAELTTGINFLLWHSSKIQRPSPTPAHRPVPPAAPRRKASCRSIPFASILNCGGDAVPSPSFPPPQVRPPAPSDARASSYFIL